MKRLLYEISSFDTLVALSVVPLIIAYFRFRKHDPEHSLRRAVGLTVALLGAIALVGALTAFLMVLHQGYTLNMSAEFTPDGGNRDSLSGVEMGPIGLGVWFLLAGGAVAMGLFLERKRFSLLSLVIGLGLVALLASMPHLLVKPQDHVASVRVLAHRTLNESEWNQLKRKLSQETLCENLPEKLTSEFGFPPEQAISKMEVEPLWRGRAEASGKIGARLTIHFSSKLSNAQADLFLDELCNRFEEAVPQSKKP